MAFVPNYPAADLSEQISTAGKEASGTCSMKFLLNGALTIGTLDDATSRSVTRSVRRISSLFGLTVQEVEQIVRDGYRPADYTGEDEELIAVLELIASGRFSRGDTEVFRSLVESLSQHDRY